MAQMHDGRIGVRTALCQRRKTRLLPFSELREVVLAAFPAMSPRQRLNTLVGSSAA
jgi:hypothetical protein